ncbi:MULTISPECIES: thioredoxin domain-containing protein [unclassified Streptomyces]|uniref:DsbA family protein n=1 Tax=unclassified Streptomyces TaxID=2593676 RepID=UPI00088C3609|nr:MULTISPECIES: thioredoxin domain-containing protein [unclassified Streptomyces]PBC85165.1 protein-disulfide isomerase [Streptomyces sp. 2321.6]SDR20924.1 Protein-disulfide isomerase [Streptomyces sp. KS_16]SED58153.1 Protein-disulfide isomerase [Streptomyces sp. 2133.1]SNC71187.1 Protein-disulfide isomerase [Streptomyces sp. 2114.4]
MPASASPTRKLAAIGAVIALVVAVIAIGVAIGKSAEDDRGTGRGNTSEAAASGAPEEDPAQQKMFDDLAKRTSRREDGDPLAVGRKDAPVVLVEYADYQCSFCGRFTRETQPGLIKKFVDAGTLRIEFRNFTVFGADSERAARASWAAGQQGKFWQLHDELYAKTRKGKALAEDKLVELARSSGVDDIDKFRSDMKSEDAERALKKDQTEGYQLGVQSTPSFLVNGRPVAGAQPAEVFAQAIKDAAARADKKGTADKNGAKDKSEPSGKDGSAAKDGPAAKGAGE